MTRFDYKDAKPRTNFERFLVRYLRDAMDKLSFTLRASRRIEDLELSVTDDSHKVMHMSTYSQGDQRYTLQHIEVYPSYRNRGIAGKALEALTRAADKDGARLDLSVCPYAVPGQEDQAPHDKAYLHDFYKRFGFETTFPGEMRYLYRSSKGELQVC